MGWKDKTAGVCGFLFNVLAPKTCLYCKKDQKYDYLPPLCGECLKNLEVIRFPYCSSCGTVLDSGGSLCYSCRHEKRKKSFAFSRSAVMFEPRIRAVIHACKYNGYKKLSRWLGEFMAERIGKYPELGGYGLVVPVPVSVKKAAERGFNQSELIAEALAAGTGKKFCRDGLLKSRETRSQAGLNREEREKNLADSFSCPEPSKIKGEKIILVDDVATTLSTLNEAAGVLTKAGALEVACYTLARE